MTEQPYRRFPGRGGRMFHHARLWEAEDHVLLVISTGFSESYRRFYYRDIQAIALCATRSGRVSSIVWGVLAILTAAGGFLAPAGVFSITLWIIAAVFALAALWHVMRGPTCRCSLRTRVQTQPLDSLNRLGTARRVLARLRPLIEAAQQA